MNLEKYVNPSTLASGSYIVGGIYMIVQGVIEKDPSVAGAGFLYLGAGAGLAYSSRKWRKIHWRDRVAQEHFDQRIKEIGRERAELEQEVQELLRVKEEIETDTAGLELVSLRILIKRGEMYLH